MYYAVTVDSNFVGWGCWISSIASQCAWSSRKDAINQMERYHQSMRYAENESEQEIASLKTFFVDEDLIAEVECGNGDSTEFIASMKEFVNAKGSDISFVLGRSGVVKKLAEHGIKTNDKLLSILYDDAHSLSKIKGITSKNIEDLREIYGAMLQEMERAYAYEAKRILDVYGQQGALRIFKEIHQQI